MEALVHQWQEREAQADRADAMSQFLAPLTDPPVLLETATLAQLASQLGDADRLLNQHQEEQGILADLKETLPLQPVGYLEGQTQTIHRLEMALAANRSLSQVLDDIQEPSSVKDLTYFDMTHPDTAILKSFLCVLRTIMPKLSQG